MLSPTKVGYERTRGSVRAITISYKTEQETFDLLVINRLSQGANVGSAFVQCDVSFSEQVPRVLNYSHTFVEEYVLSFLITKTADIG